MWRRTGDEGLDEDDEVDLELDSDNSVPYNRQFYAVPNSAIARDYNHALDVSSVERLSEMAQPTPPPEKWPAPDQIEPSMIVVVVNLEVKVEAGGGGKQLACPRGRAPT